MSGKPDMKWNEATVECQVKNDTDILDNSNLVDQRRNKRYMNMTI